MSNAVHAEMLGLTARIVTAHLENNEVEAYALSGLIRTVYQSLSTADAATSAPVEGEAAKPAVPIKKSVFPDYIVCLEDGKKLKMLRRYLLTNYGLTPDAYRTKWGLPFSYPMVAPNYANTRSEMAKTIGLGRRASDAPTAEPQVTIIRARRAKGSRG